MYTWKIFVTLIRNIFVFYYFYFYVYTFEKYFVDVFKCLNKLAIQSDLL